MQTIIMNFYVKIASDIVDSWALWQNNLFVKLGNTRLPRFVRDTSLNIDERTRKTLIKNIYIRHNLKYLFFFLFVFYLFIKNFADKNDESFFEIQIFLRRKISSPQTHLQFSIYVGKSFTLSFK